MYHPLGAYPRNLLSSKIATINSPLIESDGGPPWMKTLYHRAVPLGKPFCQKVWTFAAEGFIGSLELVVLKALEPSRQTSSPPSDPGLRWQDRGLVFSLFSPSLWTFSLKGISLLTAAALGGGSAA